MNRFLNVGIGTDAFPPTTDGVCAVALNYAKQINGGLGRATVITPKNRNQLDYKYDFEIFRYKSWWFPSNEGYTIGWPFDERLHQAIVDMNFDILHSHCPLATSYYFRRVNEIKRIPTVLTYHTKYEYDFEKRLPTQPVKDFAYHFLCNNINAADEVWVTSEGTAQSLRKVGYEGDYIVMPNGCDLPITNVPQDDVAMIKRKHNIPDDVPVFIYCGRMIWYKNIRIILDACAKLKNDGKQFRLIMLGFGADFMAIKHYAKKLGLNDYIVWTGKLLDKNEILGYYGISDLLLFPSVFDTNGLVVREAAACATPSLLVRGSCAAEGIDDCETGFLCMESAHSVAATVEKIIANPDLMKRVGKRAQSDIYISWEDSVSRAFDRYHTVIDNFNSKNS